MGVSKKETEERLREALKSVTPDLRAQIVEKATHAKGDVIPYVGTRRRRRTDVVTRILAAAACLLLALNLGGFMLRDHAMRSVDSVIQLDVNPSIQMEVNRMGRVVTAQALNEDAQRVIGTMDLSGATTPVAVNAVVGALYRAGYLRQETNTILVSVSGRNAERSSAVQEEVVSDIGASLNAYAVDASILSQTVTANENLSAEASDYGISAGKALLIDKILAVCPEYTQAELAGLTINELDQLLGTEAQEKLADVSVTTVSAAAGALASAEETAGTAEAQPVTLGALPEGTEADAEDGQAPADWNIMEYAVEDGNGENAEEQTEPVQGEDGQEPGGETEETEEDGQRSVSENSVSANSVSANSVSANSVSANSVSENSAVQNDDPGEETE